MLITLEISASRRCNAWWVNRYDDLIGRNVVGFKVRCLFLFVEVVFYKP